MAMLVDETPWRGEPPRWIGGVDVTYDPHSTACVAGLAVYDAVDGAFVYEACVAGQEETPYVPSFLGFRETKWYVRLLDDMRAATGRVPDVVLVDGNGRLHARRCGSACQLGVVAGVPTVGVAKTYDTGVPGLPSSVADLKKCLVRPGHTVLGDRVAVAIVREHCVNPIFVSVGHGLSLEDAVAVVDRVSQYRNPEPLRRADAMTRTALLRG